MRTVALLGILLAGAAAADLHGEEALPEVLGPALSGVSPEGFAVTVGDLKGPARPAELWVFDAKSKPGSRSTPLAHSQSPAASWHTLRVGGLSPAQRYRYRVLLGGQPIGDGEVSTAPTPGAARPLLIAVFGDERGPLRGVSPIAPAIVRAVLAEGPDLVLGTGDMVAMGGDLLAWRELQLSHGTLLAQVPFYPALGNHELIGDPQGRAFRALFPHAAAGHYALRYGQLLVLFLDGNRPGDAEQGRFLDEQLGRAAGDAGVRRRVVVLHHSPLSVSAHCGNARGMAPWIERFERHRVDLVVSGHDHSYQRLERNGVAYLVSGGGGAPLYRQGQCAGPDHAALQRYEAAHHYLLLRVDPGRGDAITVTAKAPQGTVLDEVTLPLPRAAAPALGEPPPTIRSAAPRPAAEEGWRWPLWILGLMPVAAAPVLLLRRRR